MKMVRRLLIIALLVFFVYSVGCELNNDDDSTPQTPGYGTGRGQIQPNASPPSGGMGPAGMAPGGMYAMQQQAPAKPKMEYQKTKDVFGMDVLAAIPSDCVVYAMVNDNATNRILTTIFFAPMNAWAGAQQGIGEITRTVLTTNFNTSADGLNSIVPSAKELHYFLMSPSNDNKARYAMIIVGGTDKDAFDAMQESQLVTAEKYKGVQIWEQGVVSQMGYGPGMMGGAGGMYPAGPGMAPPSATMQQMGPYGPMPGMSTQQATAKKVLELSDLVIARVDNLIFVGDMATVKKSIDCYVGNGDRSLVKNAVLKSKFETGTKTGNFFYVNVPQFREFADMLRAYIGDMAKLNALLADLNCAMYVNYIDMTNVIREEYVFNDIDASSGVATASLGGAAAPETSVGDPTTRCRTQAKLLGEATLKYMNENLMEFAPKKLEELLPYANDTLKIFRCPLDTRNIAYDKNAENLSDYTSYYFRNNYKYFDIKNRSLCILIYEKGYFHTLDGQPALNVFFADGHVETMTKDAFETLLDKQDEYAPESTFFGWDMNTPPTPQIIQQPETVVETDDNQSEDTEKPTGDAGTPLQSLITGLMGGAGAASSQGAPVAAAGAYSPTSTLGMFGEGMSIQDSVTLDYVPADTYYCASFNLKTIKPLIDKHSSALGEFLGIPDEANFDISDFCSSARAEDNLYPVLTGEFTYFVTEPSLIEDSPSEWVLLISLEREEELYKNLLRFLQGLDRYTDSKAESIAHERVRVRKYTKPFEFYWTVDKAQVLLFSSSLTAITDALDARNKRSSRRDETFKSMLADSVSGKAQGFVYVNMGKMQGILSAMFTEEKKPGGRSTPQMYGGAYGGQQKSSVKYMLLTRWLSNDPVVAYMLGSRVISVFTAEDNMLVSNSSNPFSSSTYFFVETPSFEIGADDAIKTCEENLRKIGIAARRYTLTNRGVLPSSLNELLEGRYNLDEEDLVCPAEKYNPNAPKQLHGIKGLLADVFDVSFPGETSTSSMSPYYGAGPMGAMGAAGQMPYGAGGYGMPGGTGSVKSDYNLVNAGRTLRELKPTDVIVAESKQHADGTRGVLFVNSKVRYVDEETYNEIMKSQKSATSPYMQPMGPGGGQPGYQQYPSGGSGGSNTGRIGF